MANLGRKYTCYSCQTKFYDLGKPEPVCPKCGADQREAEEAPVHTPRSKKVPDPPVEDEPEEFVAAESDDEAVVDEETEEVEDTDEDTDDDD